MLLTVLKTILLEVKPEVKLNLWLMNFKQRLLTLLSDKKVG